jgi:ATP-dependent Clp protease ATP-binding subunit ClpA
MARQWWLTGQAEDARSLVVEAQAEAQALGHGWIGTEHLLLAALQPQSSVRSALRDAGLTHDAVRDRVVRDLGREHDDDGAEALRSLGIDVDEVTRRVEAAVAPGALEPPDRDRAPRARRTRLRALFASPRRSRVGGHIPFTQPAKQSLALALRESRRLRSGEITAAHVVLGTMAAGCLASRTAVALGVPPEDVRQAVLARIGRAA